jgi:hypothetical protein
VTIPESTAPEPEAPDDSTIKGSATVVFVLFTVVVVPETVKLPDIVKFEPYVIESASFPAVIPLLAILAVDTAKSVI